MKCLAKYDPSLYSQRSATAIENQKGTAPGIRAKFGGKILFAMPGVPGEMRHMFDTFILPELRRLVVGQAIVVKKAALFWRGRIQDR